MDALEDSHDLIFAVFFVACIPQKNLFFFTVLKQQNISLSFFNVTFLLKYLRIK